MNKHFPLPEYFVANENLCEFLTCNGFEEFYLEDWLADDGERNFSHSQSEIYVGVNLLTNLIQLGQATGWLDHHYIALPAAALVYLITTRIKTPESQEVFHSLAVASVRS